MNGPDKRMLEREALRSMIQQWNVNRLDLFELSEPNEDLSFHGVMRFYFQDSGQKVATKCIRVASDATVGDVIETLIEKFRPDMRMLSVASYALYEVHSQEERKLSNDEKPLLVQLNWHLDDREGRFLLKNVEDKTASIVSGGDINTNFKRKLSKREKKELKKKEKLSRMKSDVTKDDKNSVAEKLYTELPETSFTRSISNPEAVMRRRRQQKLERRLQLFRSKDGGPDTGGTLKIYGESLCPDVPYKTLLLSINDCAASVVREMLDKYGLVKIDPQLYCLIQVNTQDNSEYILDDDECPLAIVMTHPQRGSIMFHVRRRPADCQPRRRKKKSGSLRAGGGGPGGTGGILVETHSDGSPLDNGRSVRISGDIVEVGSANGVALQLYGPSIQPRHCVLACNDGVVTLTPIHADAHTYVNGQRIYHTTILQHGCVVKFDRISTFRFVDPAQENKLSRQISQSQNFDTGSVYDRSPTSPMLDSSSGTMNQTVQGQIDMMNNFMESTGESGFPRAMSPLMNSNMMGSQDNFGMAYNLKNHMEPDQMSGYSNNNNNNLKVECENLPQQFSNSKSDIRENHFASPYNASMSPTGKDHQNSNKVANNQYKDNYETTFDLDGNIETKSICSAKSGGSGHENRVTRGQEAILPAVLEFPENTQHLFLQNVITKLDVNSPAFKLAPVYTLYLCARYRASTHYRPELTPTERAHKLTTLLHHIATLIQATVQEKYIDATLQAFWMANSSELLHFLKCDRHISAFTVQAQDILSNSVQTAFSNLVGCFHTELSQVLMTFLEETSNESEAVGVVIGVLNSAMALLRRCRVNAALTIQLFSQLFYYINVWCFNKVVNSPYMMCAGWGSLVSSRLAPIGAWAERQGLELAADCNFALIHQCAHLLQAPKSSPEDIASLASTCFKLNSVQLRCLLGGYFEEVNGTMERLPPDLVEVAVKHAQGVADELHRADGREIVVEENSSLPLSLLIPEEGFSADVVRGIPSGLAEFLSPLQRAGLCRLAPQPHSQGHWTVYMTGFNGNNPPVKSVQQPVVDVIQLQKNSNGIGLSIVAAKGAGQSKLGIYIKSVVPGGAAAVDQRLQAGDQLLAVDGYSLVGITQERAAEHLVRTGPVVTLHVAKQGAVLHGLATLLRQPSPQTSRGGYYSNYPKYSRSNSKSLQSSSNDSLDSYHGIVPSINVHYCEPQDIFDRLHHLDPTFYHDNSQNSNIQLSRSNIYSYKNRPCHREQSVDSNTQSCDSSDCSLSHSMDDLDKNNVSKGPEKLPEARKTSLSNNFQELVKTTINYDEIPFIDDFDCEPISSRQDMHHVDDDTYYNSINYVIQQRRRSYKKVETGKKQSTVPTALPKYDKDSIARDSASGPTSRLLKLYDNNEHNLLDTDEISDMKKSRYQIENLNLGMEKNTNAATVKLGFGKVKAIAKQFNSNNVAYQSKTPGRKFPSNPDLSKSTLNVKDTHKINAAKSLVNIQFSDKISKNELSDEEKHNILLQLEDWSKNGTRGSIIYQTQLDSQRVDDSRAISSDDSNVDDINRKKIHLDRKYGSLERLTNLTKPKDVELVLCNFATNNKEKSQPAILKTKLVIPRKKFPQSYIVKKKGFKEREALEKTKVSYNIRQSCPNLLEKVDIEKINENKKNKPTERSSFSKSTSMCNINGFNHSKTCRMENSYNKRREKLTNLLCKPTQYGQVISRKNWKSVEDISPRRMSERDLPSKVEMEQNPQSHIAATVKSSKSVPALHEHLKQHEVFNPGYSRASSNNSIPAMVGLKGKPTHAPTTQTDQNSFYQNLSVYRTSALGDRSSTLRNSQNNLQIQMQSQLKNMTPETQNATDRGGQRPQSAFFGSQNPQNNVNNNLRTAQSTKDLAFNNENPGNYPVKGGYPSMPNVNQAYPTNTPMNGSQSYNQFPAANPGNYNYNNNSHPRGPMSPPGNPYNSVSPGNQYPNQMQYNQQNQMQYNQGMPNAQGMGNNHSQFGHPSNNQLIGSNPNLRGHAKMMEMSEEVTRRQQRGSMNPYGDHPIRSPLQPKRSQSNQDNHGLVGNVPMSPTKQQPPVAPKPQNFKRDSSMDVGQDIPEGPPLPPTATHPLYNQQSNEEDGSYLASTTDPPAVSYYPAQRPGQNNQSHFPPNPWEREEREKELEVRRVAGRAWRDQQIASLQSLPERTPQQEQQLRALTLERDFERRAQESQVDDEDKDMEYRAQKNAQQSGLLRLVNNNNNNNNNSPQDLTLVPVTSNIVSSIQPISVATSNTNGEQLTDNVPSQQENRISQAPPIPPPIQPKSILKSNLRLDNLNSSSPQSPSKSQKNASFSANLTPQNSKYDYSINNQLHSNLNKYEQQSNMYGNSASKYDISNANMLSPNQLSQAMGDLYVNSNSSYNRIDNANSGGRYDQQLGQENMAPPPPERGSSFAIMSQQQALRSNISTTLPMSAYNQNNNPSMNNTLIMKDKRVSFHDKDASKAINDSRDEEIDVVREDPDVFIMQAENMLQSPSTPTGSNVMHTPGVIGAQEVYRDPRQKRLAEQQKAQQAEGTPIPEKLSFKEKMKMFALESGENNTPKDKVKISRAQRDIDAVH